MTAFEPTPPVEGVHIDNEVRALLAIVRAEAMPRLDYAGYKLQVGGRDGLGLFDNPQRGLRLIHSLSREDDGNVWAHVSLSRRDRVLPSWEQTRDAWWLIYPDVAGVIVVAPKTEHVNIGEVTHVWGDLNYRAIPDFTRGQGTI